jgi:hypothetical protein
MGWTHKRLGPALGLAAAGILVGVAAARADDDAVGLPDAELQGLCEKALGPLVAAVCSQGQAQLALDDDGVISEGPHAPPGANVLNALRAAATSAKVKFTKHADDLTVPILHARETTFVRANPKETIVDHELYLEVEGPTREVLGAAIQDASKTGPGAPTAGYQSPATLDAVAEKFLKSWLQEKRPPVVTVIPYPKPPRRPNEDALAERITTRLLHKTTLVAPTRGGGPEVARPPGVKLLAPACVLFVEIGEKGSNMAVAVQGQDPTNKKVLFEFRDPAESKAKGPPRPVALVKKIADSIIFKISGGSYPMKRGEKAKVWICELQLDPKIKIDPDYKNEITKAFREELLKREVPQYAWEPHDGAVTNADAKEANVLLTFTPVIFFDAKGRRMCGVEVRQTETDKVLDRPADVLPAADKNDKNKP